MAEKLKGLLDRANSVLGGLLGDFPAGFNSGAVAGVAGYPGDVAYMLDTAGRALTGQDSMPAAQDFPGTTDYLAAKAGYPIPQSFSGQLGAAVGGMLNPGPGDLARFAPVLAAIPFWHGSPHKYDAVDLAHIGSGEGAQAYGWGYYGAESKGVATGYRDSLTPWNQLEYQGTAITKLDDDTRIAVEWVKREIEHGAPDPDWAKAVAAKKLMARGDKSAAAMAAQIDPEQIKLAEGHLYRGEYRWPDPAKEAATPLTESDLLDWDKPLSEQSPQVKGILEKAGAEVFDNEIRDGLRLAGGGTLRVGTKPPYPYALEMGGNQYGLTEADVKRLIGEGTEGKSVYQGLSTKLGGDDAASKYLSGLGIPGIRYLDQMSRDAGEGTRNYVMFDDKGIKLLERNGEPIPAAAEFAARREGKPKPYREAMGGQ